MPPIAIFFVCVAGLTGALLGVGLRSNLAHLTYRIIGPRHDERDFPYPGNRWWVPWTLGIAWFALATAYAHPSGWPWLLLWLPFAVSGEYLVAVDFDVMRLPDAVLGGTAVYSLLAGGLLIYLDRAGWLSGLVGAVASGLLFLIVHLVSRGALGFGDVKYVTICGWCLGLMGWHPIFIGLILACVCAIIWAVTRGATRFAFGPWLALGTVWTAILVGFDLVGALPFAL